MATARLGSRRSGGDADTVVDVVRRRRTLAPTFRVPGRVCFRRSAMGYGG